MPPDLPRRLPDGLLPALRARLEALYGARLVRAVLFGSYARGEATAESDVDVLVVLRGDAPQGDESRDLAGVTVELLDRLRLYTSFVAVAEEAAGQDRPLLRNVREDGIPLVS